MTLATLKRIVRMHLPDVFFSVLSEDLVRHGILGASWWHDLDDTGNGVPAFFARDDERRRIIPMIAYGHGLSAAQRNHVILHELAHLLFDRGAVDAAARVGYVGSPWREARADHWASNMLALLEGTASR